MSVSLKLRDTSVVTADEEDVASWELLYFIQKD